MPATEQLNIRVTPAVKKRFQERAKREGISQAELLGALLKMRGKLEFPPKEKEVAPVGTVGAPAGADPPTAADCVDFAVWLSGRTGTPRALTARAIAAGRVAVAGVPFTAQKIPRELLGSGVVYDGNAV